MSKKIVAMLMAVAMAFSLLPVTALATGGTPTPANATQPRTGVTADTQDGVHISNQRKLSKMETTTTSRWKPM